MKRTTYILASCVVAGAIALPAFAANVTPPLLGGDQPAPLIAPAQTQTQAGRYPVQVDGSEIGVDACLMVPLRAVAEKLGFEVIWNDGTVLVDNGVLHTKVTIGVDSYIVTTSNPDLIGMSAPFSLGAAPYVVDGVAYVPLGLFGPLLGNKEGAIVMEEGKVLIRSEGADHTQIPNPFAACKTLEEAGEIAGFTLSVPDTISGEFTNPVFRAMKGSLIEVIYGEGEQQIRIRKGSGDGNISGDYHVYPQSETATVGDVQVTLSGKDGKIYLATWADGGYSFAVQAGAGMSRDSMTALIQEVQ